jgi:hypothetical protein
MKTKVIYRKFSDGEVIALFPEEPNSIHESNTCMSYQHVGQHGGASIALCHELAPAKPEEYEALHNELIAVGYTELVVVPRVTKAMNKERMGAIQAYRDCEAQTKAKFN